MRRKYKKSPLSLEERQTIQTMYYKGHSQSQIANAIGRPQSCISLELKRNMGKRGYKATEAHSKASKRKRPTYLSNLTDSELEKLKDLLQEGRCKQAAYDFNVSQTTIYRWATTLNISRDAEAGGRTEHLYLYKQDREILEKYIDNEPSVCNYAQALRKILREELCITTE